MPTTANEPEQVVNFLDGMIEGAYAAGWSARTARRIGREIFPSGQKSCWRDLLLELDPDETSHLGHQFACLLSSLKPRELDSAVPTIHWMMWIIQNSASGRPATHFLAGTEGLSRSSVTGRCEQLLGDFWAMPLADDPRMN